jgi:hypothetical protein
VKLGKKMEVNLLALSSKTRSMVMVDSIGLTVATIMAILKMEYSMDKVSITFLTSRRHMRDLLLMA